MTQAHAHDGPLARSLARLARLRQFSVGSDDVQLAIESVDAVEADLMALASELDRGRAGAVESLFATWLTRLTTLRRCLQVGHGDFVDAIVEGLEADLSEFKRQLDQVAERHGGERP